jgi:hypothetical protein
MIRYIVYIRRWFGVKDNRMETKGTVRKQRQLEGGTTPRVKGLTQWRVQKEVRGVKC